MKFRKSATPGSSTATAARNPTEKSPALARRKTPRRPTKLLRAETIESSSLYNKDLAPVPGERRTWRTYNYAALWISMSVNIPTYMLASGMIAGGMNCKQALFTVFLGNVLVLIPMLLVRHSDLDWWRSHQRHDRGPRPIVGEFPRRSGDVFRLFLASQRASDSSWH